MQAIADLRCRFHDVVIGWPGSAHDVHALCRSTEMAASESLFGGCVEGDNEDRRTAYLHALLGSPATTPVCHNVADYSLSWAELVLVMLKKM